MLAWFRKADSVQSVIDWLGGERVVTDDLSCYLCVMPDGERFITPDSDVAYLASVKGATVTGLPTVVGVGFVTDNNMESDYG